LKYADKAKKKLKDAVHLLWHGCCSIEKKQSTYSFEYIGLDKLILGLKSQALNYWLPKKSDDQPDFWNGKCYFTILTKSFELEYIPNDIKLGAGEKCNLQISKYPYGKGIICSTIAT